MLCDERASLRRECILNNANRPQHLVLGGIIASYDIAWDRRFELRQEGNEINCLDDFRPLEVFATKWVSCPENRKKTKDAPYATAELQNARGKKLSLNQRYRIFRLRGASSIGRSSEVRSWSCSFL